MPLRKPPFCASCLLIFSLIVLCGLGAWQVKRLAWKTDLLAQIEAQYNRQATPIDFTAVPPDLKFYRGMLTGRFVRGQDILIAPRTYDGAPGYHVLTPFTVRGRDDTILVNRGWIGLNASPADYAVNAAPVTITGLLRPPLRANIFVPPNDPDNNAWYRIDLAQMARHLSVEGDLLPYVFYSEGEHASVSVEDNLPIASATKPHLNNNHRQYAFFWFAMAGIALVVFALRFIVVPRS